MNLRSRRSTGTPIQPVAQAQADGLALLELDLNAPPDLVLSGRDINGTLGTIERKIGRVAGQQATVRVDHLGCIVKVALRLIIIGMDTRIQVRVSRDEVESTHVHPVQSPRNTLHRLILDSIAPEEADLSPAGCRDLAPGDVCIYVRSMRRVLLLEELPYSNPKRFQVKRIDGPNPSRRMEATVDELIACKTAASQSSPSDTLELTS